MSHYFRYIPESRFFFLLNAVIRRIHSSQHAREVVILLPSSSLTYYTRPLRDLTGCFCFRSCFSSVFVISHGRIHVLVFCFLFCVVGTRRNFAPGVPCMICMIMRSNTLLSLLLDSGLCTKAFLLVFVFCFKALNRFASRPLWGRNHLGI